MSWFKVIAFAFITAVFMICLMLTVHVYGYSRFVQGAANYEMWLEQQKEPCQAALMSESDFAEQMYTGNI